MGGIFLISGIAALGVLLAGIAVAIPAARTVKDRPRWESGVALQPASLRDRINHPSQGLAERNNRQHRPNDALSPAENLAQSDPNLRSSECVENPGGFDKDV